MKRSTIGVVFILFCYLLVVGIIMLAVAESFGSNSIAMYLTIIAIGPIGLLLIVTHKGLDSFLKNFDKNDE